MGNLYADISSKTQASEFMRKIFELPLTRTMRPAPEGTGPVWIVWTAWSDRVASEEKAVHADGEAVNDMRDRFEDELISRLAGSGAWERNHAPRNPSN